MNLADINYTSVDYNMMELLNNAKWGAGQSLDSWSSSRGFDLHSFTGNPQFTSPGSPNYNLIPLSTSPVIDAGHPTLSSPIDYTGATRNGMSDIGAYEYFILSTSDNQIDFNKNSITCFPNPTNDVINIENTSETQLESIKIYDMNGRLIREIAITTSDTQHINLSDLSSGVYLFNIYNDQVNTVKRVIKN